MKQAEQSDDGVPAIGPWMEFQNSEARTNLRTVHRSEVIGQCMLHIDKNPPKAFTPRMPRSAEDGEDCTIPRVTVSQSLTGCIVGYHRLDGDFLGSQEQSKDDPFLGGYVISQLDFDYAIKPNARMVPSGPRSDEYWLVHYSEKTREYIPSEVGRLFATSCTVETTALGKKACYVLYLHVNSGKKMLLHDDRILTSGKYRMELSYSHDKLPSLSTLTVRCEPVSDEEYLKLKSYTANLLSADTKNKPLYAEW